MISPNYFHQTHLNITVLEIPQWEEFTSPKLGGEPAWGLLLVHHNCHLKANTLWPRPLTGELKAGVKVTRVS